MTEYPDGVLPGFTPNALFVELAAAKAKIRELETELKTTNKDRNYWAKSSENYATKMVAYKLEIEGVNGLKARIALLERELEKVNGLASGWNAAMRQAEARAAELEGKLLTIVGMKPVSVRQKAAWDAWLEEHPAREREEC